MTRVTHICDVSHSVLQYVAVCCSVLQCVAVCCRREALSESVLQCVAVRCSVLQCAAVCCRREALSERRKARISATRLELRYECLTEQY